MNNKYLQETPFLDYADTAIQDFVAPIRNLKSQKEQAVALYFKVRDGYRYDPYHLDLTQKGLKASTIVHKNRAWCVEKAILLAASLRALAIPSRLGYGVVINHIGIEKLLRYLKRDEIVFHGYVAIFIDGKWIKATPAFDPAVCKIAGVDPLDWDGEEDSMFQAFVGTQQFMEYIHFYGEFDDVPHALMKSEMEKYYPHLFEKEVADKSFTFKFLEPQ